MMKGIRFRVHPWIFFYQGPASQYHFAFLLVRTCKINIELSYGAFASDHLKRCDFKLKLALLMLCKYSCKPFKLHQRISIYFFFERILPTRDQSKHLASSNMSSISEDNPSLSSKQYPTWTTLLAFLSSISTWLLRGTQIYKLLDAKFQCLPCSCCSSHCWHLFTAQAMSGRKSSSAGKQSLLLYP